MLRGIVVTSIASDYCYFVSTCGESYGKIGEVLCCRNYIRVKALIEKQDSQIQYTKGTKFVPFVARLRLY